MKIARRDIKLTQLFQKVYPFARILYGVRLFNDPIGTLNCYIKRNSPSVVSFKDGTKIHLSSNPDDIVTVFVVYFHHDYGSIVPGSVVVDIGANIGVFAVYAATKGAKRVYAFEPNIEAYTILCENVRSNGLEDVIRPFNCAISDKDGMVRIPRQSSPYNSIIKNDGQDNGRQRPVADVDAEYDSVPAYTLDRILQEQGVERIDMLKLDCEGAEFDILPGLSTSSCNKISDIRMEYHAEPEALIESLIPRGFKVIKRHGLPKIGRLWLARQ